MVNELTHQNITQGLVWWLCLPCNTMARMFARIKTPGRSSYVMERVLKTALVDWGRYFTKADKNTRTKYLQPMRKFSGAQCCLHGSYDKWIYLKHLKQNQWWCTQLWYQSQKKMLSVPKIKFNEHVMVISHWCLFQEIFEVQKLTWLINKQILIKKIMIISANGMNVCERFIFVKYVLFGHMHTQ